MKGYNLLEYIISDSISYSKFGGMFAVDQLIFPLPNKDVYYICNTDFYSKKGKHWVVIYHNQNTPYVEYFDSLGQKPTKLFIDFMSQRGKQILYSKKRIQSRKSIACGYFCLYFIYLRSRYVEFSDIINNFSNDMINNEKYVIDFVNHSFD